MPLLEISNLSIRFDAYKAVDELSCGIARGERFGLVGESGSGKTLTALAIAGLLPEDAAMDGSICFNGAPLPQSERDMARLRGKHIGIVFQEPMTALNPLMRVGEQIAEAIWLNNPDRPNHHAAALLAEVGLESKHGAHYPHQLSGGQRQRVMIAMALAGEPDLLIADEPTSALDLITQRKVLDRIAEICTRRHMALLFISHDLKAVSALCSRVAVLHRGRLVEAGTCRKIFATPAASYTQKLVNASHFTAPPVKRKIGSRILLSVESVTRGYRQGSFFRRTPVLRTVDNVSFTMRQGECVALVGPSGCGKTTLARLIVGLDKASAGLMRFDGSPYRGSDLPDTLRRALSLVFQDPFGSFDPRRSIAASLAQPLRLEPGLVRNTIRPRLLETMAAVGLDATMLDRYPHAFSGGQRQRLAIARALVTRPRLLVLDEPVSALDMSIRGEILALLSRLQADYGLTCLIISHDLDMVHTLADRIMVMAEGKIVEEADPETLFTRPKHRLTQEIIAARLPDIEK